MLTAASVFIATWVCASASVSAEFPAFEPYIDEVFNVFFSATANEIQEGSLLRLALGSCNTDELFETSTTTALTTATPGVFRGRFWLPLENANFFPCYYSNATFAWVRVSSSTSISASWSDPFVEAPPMSTALGQRICVPVMSTSSAAVVSSANVSLLAHQLPNTGCPVEVLDAVPCNATAEEVPTMIAGALAVPGVTVTSPSPAQSPTGESCVEFAPSNGGIWVLCWRPGCDRSFRALGAVLVEAAPASAPEPLPVPPPVVSPPVPPPVVSPPPGPVDSEATSSTPVPSSIPPPVPAPSPAGQAPSAGDGDPAETPSDWPAVEGTRPPTASEWPSEPPAPVPAPSPSPWPTELTDAPEGPPPVGAPPNADDMAVEPQ
eukprot:TRINITY_DN562_c0_g1_i1.p1 TRINITY_DN562_c0_g1~~TRINITY_DN562_c0_g1_i1.p1  ORF type:complete len:378 (+),score=74.79 TRINITY_DN562_c0_g1_i1:191-1324(+)